MVPSISTSTTLVIDSVQYIAPSKSFRISKPVCTGVCVCNRQDAQIFSPTWWCPCHFTPIGSYSARSERFSLGWNEEICALIRAKVSRGDHRTVLGNQLGAQMAHRFHIQRHLLAGEQRPLLVRFINKSSCFFKRRQTNNVGAMLELHWLCYKLTEQNE